MSSRGADVASGARVPRIAAADAERAHPVDVEPRIAAADWASLSQELDAHGAAVLEGLLEPAACEALVELYGRDAIFRSRVVRARHGLGGEEYRFFSYPWRGLGATMPPRLYPHLVPIA